MFALWAVARHTFRQCLRMKVAGLFIVLLAAALTAMPFLKMMKGDGTLAGQIRTFLSYAVSITAVLGSLMTIFLATSIVASDMRNKHIFSVATKPIARWEYIVGRWIGVVWIDAMLVVAAGCTIYALAQYLRTAEALHPDDRRAVETEVFTARERIAPDPIDIEIARRVAARIKTLKEQGAFRAAIGDYSARSGGDKAAALELMIADITEEVRGTIQSIPPNGTRVWRFSGIRVRGNQTRGNGHIVKMSPQGGMMRIDTSPEILGALTYAGPVRIGDVEGQVHRLEKDCFVVHFRPEEMARTAFTLLGEGKTVQIVADPTVQITYKSNPASSPPDATLSSIWEIRNDRDNVFYRQRRTDAAEGRNTLTVSGRLVDSDGTLRVRYVNIPKGPGGFATTVTVLDDDIAVLYRAGSFEWNLVRGITLIFIQLVFLAALGVMAGSFVSFPVASLFCFVILTFQLGRNFIINAVSYGTITGGEPTVLDYFSLLVVKCMNVLLPDLGRTSPADSLVDGMNISWEQVGGTAVWGICVQSLLVIVIASLLFHRRELARVQV